MTMFRVFRNLYRSCLSKLNIQEWFCDLNDDNKPHGPCEVWENGRILYKGTHENGLETGVWEKYNHGKLINRTTYQKGLKEGAYESYDRDGQLQEKCTYKGDQLEGLYEAYFEDGCSIKERGFYKKGEMDGFWEQYHRNGQSKIKCFYQNGERYGMAEYDENGWLMGVYGSLVDLKLIGESAKEVLEKLQIEEAKIEAKEYTVRRQKTVKSLKEQLEKATDPAEVSQAVKFTRTPERRTYAERITKVRRARDILSEAAKRAKAQRDTNLLNEVIDIARPYAGRYAAMMARTRRKRLSNRIKSGRD